MLLVLVLAALAGSTLLFPAFGGLVMGGILIIQSLIVSVRFAVPPSGGLRLATDEPRAADGGAMTVFSIHVATHNEPPEMVCETLRALDRQDWPADRYEVIVIDNNTADARLWQPVQALCRGLGPRFRFLHRIGVQGAKAGALNIALAQTRADATHIVTVDADYVVQPDFLAQAARALHETGADYIQYPQSYVACRTIAAGVDAELEEYFRTHARIADGSEAVLLTGTLCVIAKEALLAVGGWSGRTTTEDAETGVRLCRKGFSGRFIDRIVGQGFLPLSLPDLERQRHRWASGNLQTLIGHAPAIFLGRDGMDWQRRGAILSQLTAWLNLSLLPAIVLILAVLAGQATGPVAALAGASVLLSLADIVVRLVWRGLQDRTPPAVIAAAICNRLALAPVAAMATVQALAGRPMPFIVTDKSGASGGRHSGMPLAGLLLCAAAALALPGAMQAGGLIALSVLALMMPFPAALATARTLSRYRGILTTSRNGTLV